MKAVILAGGVGSRLTDEAIARPKPLVEIGGKPIPWHIMKIYLAHGIKDLVICLGYRGYMIKEYFANYFLHMSDVTFDMANNMMEIHQVSAEPWRVTLVDAGETTQTGGRLRRVQPYLGDEDFCFAHGDGVGNIVITKLVAFHRSEGRLVTVTAMQPPGRFGALRVEVTRIVDFAAKPARDGGWVNGGFFVLSPEVVTYIGGDETAWERAPMERLSSENRVSAFFHRGFWQPMDTLRDKNHLEELWASGRASWKVW